MKNPELNFNNNEKLPAAELFLNDLKPVQAEELRRYISSVRGSGSSDPSTKKIEEIITRLKENKN